MQQQLYELLNSDPSQLVGNNSLQQFMYNNQWSNLDYIYYASKYVAEGKYDIVDLLLGFWPGTSELDNAYYIYFDWLVQMHSDPEWVPDANEVLTLASQCPLKNGMVIYAVCNLYNAITQEIHQFEDNCEGTSQFKGSNTPPSKGFIRLHPRKDIKTIMQEIKPVVLYPNPAKTTVNITGSKMKQVEIIDMLGRRVQLKEELGGIEKATINIQQLQKGLFLVRVIGLNGKVNTQKLVIEKYE